MASRTTAADDDRQPRTEAVSTTADKEPASDLRSALVSMSHGIQKMRMDMLCEIEGPEAGHLAYEHVILALAALDQARCFVKIALHHLAPEG